MARTSHGRQVVLDAFRRNPKASISELSAETGYSRTTVHHHLSRLDQAGVIQMNHEVGNHSIRRVRQAKRQQKSRIGRKAVKKVKLTDKSEKAKALKKRIEAVVEKALNSRPMEDAELTVRPNGVKVVVKKVHWVGVGSTLE